MPQSRPALSSKARLRWDRREQVYFLLYPERGLRLNETAAAILQLCDGQRSLDEILRELGRRYPAQAPATLQHEAIGFLEEIRVRGLLRADSPDDSPADSPADK